MSDAVNEEANRARIDAFLAAVAPVAESAKVRLASHSHDPCSAAGYKGVTRVLGTLPGHAGLRAHTIQRGVDQVTARARPQPPI